MIRNVVFDMGGVLIDLDVNACVKAFMCLSPNPMDTLERMKAGDMLGNGGKTSLHDFELGNISTEEYLSGVLKECKTGTTLQMVSDATMTILKDIPTSRKQAILDLRAKGYHVYLLSNINDLHWPVCQAKMEAPLPDANGKNCSYSINEFFHDLFLSHELHLCKPDSRIYDTLIARTGIIPAETMYIDDVEENVQGGLKAGLQAVMATGDEWIPLVKALPTIVRDVI